MWPRGGGLWDQDPILVRDFRAIRKAELQWKEQQQHVAQQGETGGAPSDLSDALDQYISDMEDEAAF